MERISTSELPLDAYAPAKLNSWRGLRRSLTGYRRKAVTPETPEKFTGKAENKEKKGERSPDMKRSKDLTGREINSCQIPRTARQHLCRVKGL